jgi:hypothetical protein
MFLIPPPAEPALGLGDSVQLSMSAFFTKFAPSSTSPALRVEACQ